jgi:hydrogenase maturation protein HypF
MPRAQLVVRGIVQGVGFRPFVASLARRLGLGGHVRNDSGWVFIEVEGTADALAAFGAALREQAPPLAVVDEVTTRELSPLGETTFVIDPSGTATGRRTSIPADVATCDECLRELADPSDRRYRYPFLNCTRCGPRFTIIESLPYDRAGTTMRRFAMCEACRAEYEDPGNRRYHAEPTACPACGPRLWFEAPGVRADGDEALAQATRWLAEGRIVAVKGLGGFHLACDARHDRAVATLRQRKGRGDKPFALMVRDLDAVRALCHVSPEEATQLTSPARPIVLLLRREVAVPRADDEGAVPMPLAHVAPGQLHLGMMLPYSPLHHLLVDEAPLVMTSGNRSDEPIAHDNDEARTRLVMLADAFLLHDRDIHAVCDDSVIRVFRNHPLPIRRSRGYAPVPVRLPFEVPPMLAVGGELKATFCLAEGRDAYLSQHIGDMESMETLAVFERAVAHLTKLFGIEPAVVAIDMHPGYLSSRWGRAWAEARGLRVVPVQHHHAHHAAVMAEHGLAGDAAVIGVVLDGTGYGLDGTVWGGEIFEGGYGGVRRAGQLASVALPASDRDMRSGYRLALAHLMAAGVPFSDDLAPWRACPAGERTLLAQRFSRGIGMTASSSMGRLFDAVASILDVRHESAYEAQGAMELEALATSARAEDVARGTLTLEVVERDGRLQLDPGPLLRALVDEQRRGTAPAILAARFHAAVATGVVALVRRLSAAPSAPPSPHLRAHLRSHHRGHLRPHLRGHLRPHLRGHPRGHPRGPWPPSATPPSAPSGRPVALSGGVFQNVLLLTLVVDALEAAGFRPLTHRLVPPNDGGLSLGQVAVAGCGKAWGLGPGA